LGSELSEGRPESPGREGTTNLQLHEGVKRGKGNRQGTQKESRERRYFRDRAPFVDAEPMNRMEDKKERRALSQIWTCPESNYKGIPNTLTHPHLLTRVSWKFPSL